MKILIGQTNPIPGDFVGNTAQIQDGIALASQQGVELAVFPELCIPGYLVQDKMREPDFVNNNLIALQDLIAFSRAMGPHKPHIIVGYVDRNRAGSGKPFRNMAAVIHDGVLVGTYQKWLLPYYDVFDEGRYFAPGSQLLVFEMCGKRWGVLICEDWWYDKGQDDYNHTTNPVEQYRRLGVKNLIAINASPFEIGKCARRIAQAKELGAEVFVFANCRGGMDELLFPGDSFVLMNSGLHHLVTAQETPHHEIVSLEGNCRYIQDGRNDWDTLKDALVLGLRDYTTKSGFSEVVVANSGGVDSALVIYLGCEAVGPENVHSIRMPSPISSDHSLLDAEQLCVNLGIPEYNRETIPIDHIPVLDHIHQYTHHRGQRNPIADQNIQPRLRANILWDFANAYGWLALATGNKTELAFGYCTLWGDMAGGYNPIKDLYKGQVYQVVARINELREKQRLLGIPENIFKKKPSAELAPGQFDEQDLLLYPLLDAIALAYVEYFINTYPHFAVWVMKQKPVPKKHWEATEKEVRQLVHPMVYDWIKTHPLADYERMVRKIDSQEFKRRLSPVTGTKVSRVCFGSGRRIPIVKR